MKNPEIGLAVRHRNSPESHGWVKLIINGGSGLVVQWDDMEVTNHTPDELIPLDTEGRDYVDHAARLAGLATGQKNPQDPTGKV